MQHHVSNIDLSRYVDGEVSEDAARRIREHVQSCHRCDATYREFQHVAKLLSATPEIGLPPTHDREFRRRLEELAAQPSHETFWLDVPSRLAEALQRLMAPWVLPRVAVVSVGVLALTLWWVSLPFGVPQIIVSSGVVEAYAAGNDRWETVVAEHSIGEGERLQTDTNSYFDIELEGYYRLRVKEQTRLVARQPTPSRREREIRFAVSDGMVLVEASQQLRARNVRLAIETPEALLRVRGTGFAVEVDPNGAGTWVGVDHGSVAVESLSGPHRDNEVLVVANHKVLVAPGGGVSLPTLLTPAERLKLRELEAIGQVVIGIALPHTSDRVERLFSDVRLYVQGRYPSAVAELAARAVEEMQQAGSQDDPQRYVQGLETLERILEVTNDGSSTVQLLLYLGAGYQRLGMIDESLKAFHRVTEEHAETEWSSLAQCAIGVVYEEGLGDLGLAIAAYQAVVRRYPNSLDAIEAMIRLKALEAAM